MRKNLVDELSNEVKNKLSGFLGIGYFGLFIHRGDDGMIHHSENTIPENIWQEIIEELSIVK